MVFWTFHISAFVNTTDLVVNIDTLLYMCMEAISCQSDRSPERLMISHTPSSGGRRNVEETLPSCGVSFEKKNLSENKIFLTFQNSGILDLPHSTFVNTTALVVNIDTLLYMCMEILNGQSERSPKRLMIYYTSSTGGTSNQLRWEKEFGGNSPNLWGEFLKKTSFWKQDIPNLWKLWHSGPSTFMYLSILQIW